MNRSVFTNTFAYKLIYIFSINDESHKGLLKIGDTTVESSKPLEELVPNCHELKQAAKNRIDQYTSTAGIRYNLLHTEIALIEGTNQAARDNKVHEVLTHSGIDFCLHRFHSPVLPTFSVFVAWGVYLRNGETCFGVHLE